MNDKLWNYLIGFIVDLLVAVVANFLSNSPIIAIAVFVVTPAALAIAFRIKTYYDVLKVSGLQEVVDREKVDWLKYYKESKKVKILMTRGVGVVDTEKGTLYQVIKALPRDWDGEIRILLLNPNSKYIEDRANDIGISTETLKNQINTSANNLRELKKMYNLNLDWAFYDDKPLLRFILFDNCGFLTYWAANPERPLHPSRDIKIVTGPHSLYRALSQHFDQLWEKSSKGE